MHSTLKGGLSLYFSQKLKFRLRKR